MQDTRNQETPIHLNYQQGQDIKKTQALNKEGFFLSSQVASVSFMLKFEKYCFTKQGMSDVIGLKKLLLNAHIYIYNDALFIQATIVTIQSGLNISFSTAFVMSNCHGVL